MSTAWLLGTAVVVVILLRILLGMLVPKAPKETHFRCERCGQTTPHGDRTLFAWSRGERDFYCDACNAAWLESCTPQQLDKYERRMAGLARFIKRRRNAG